MQLRKKGTVENIQGKPQMSWGNGRDWQGVGIYGGELL